MWKIATYINRMSAARETLQQAADKSIDASFAKCVRLFTSESLQFENEIHSQISCFNCASIALANKPVKQKTRSFSTKNIEPLCKYLEDAYIKSYRQLLKDKNINSSLKNLISNQLQILLSSLTQLRLFKEVKPSYN